MSGWAIAALVAVLLNLPVVALPCAVVARRRIRERRQRGRLVASIALWLAVLEVVRLLALAIGGGS